MLAGTESDKERRYHLTFNRKHKPKGKKTNIYKVYNSSGTWIKIGEVKWYGAFRQYCFYPETDTMFSKGCLELINNFLDKVNKRHRNKLRRKKNEK